MDRSYLGFWFAMSFVHEKMWIVDLLEQQASKASVGWNTNCVMRALDVPLLSVCLQAPVVASKILIWVPVIAAVAISVPLGLTAIEATWVSWTLVSTSLILSSSMFSPTHRVVSGVTTYRSCWYEFYRAQKSCCLGLRALYSCSFRSLPVLRALKG